MGFSSGPSLADIAAVTNGNRSNNGSDGGWGEWIWAFLIFALFGWGGFGGNGFGNNGGSAAQGALTRGDLCMDMNFQDVQNGVRNISDQVGLGFANLNSTICNQQYDTAGLINGLENVISQGFNTMNVSNLQSANALQAQLAQCCCENREAIAQVRYDMASNTCAITNQMNQGFNAVNQTIIDQFCQLKMEQKDAEIARLQAANTDLRFGISQANQTTEIVNAVRPTPIPAWQVPNPFAFSGNYGCGCGNNGYYYN